MVCAAMPCGLCRSWHHKPFSDTTLKKGSRKFENLPHALLLLFVSSWCILAIHKTLNPKP